MSIRARIVTVLELEYTCICCFSIKHFTACRGKWSKRNSASFTISALSWYVAVLGSAYFHVPLHLSTNFPSGEVLTFKMLVYFCRDKLKVASEELQKKKAYIDSLEPKVSSSGEWIIDILTIIDKWRLLSGTFLWYKAVQSGSNFKVCGWNPSVWLFKWKLLRSNFMWYCLLCCTSWF